MHRTPMAVAAALALTVLPAAAGETTPSEPGAEVYFINLEDGATVESPVTILFGLKGMGIAPAGIERPGTGHHHLIINETVEGEELSEPIPADDNHLHFGGGQTQATVDLPAGTHVLQLVLGDWGHVPHDPPVMSERITVTVK
ncbi:MAG: DUF4399 domain-containing protein [Pseudomonadota bacterium]